MICANTDDTERIISERQLRTLTQLGKNLTDTQTHEQVIEGAIATLTENPFDFPFAVFRTIANHKARLIKATPLGQHAASFAEEVDLRADHEIAVVLSKAVATRKVQVVENVTQKIGVLPSGAWTKPPEKVIVLPIVQTGSKDPYGVLVVGLNPYRLFDEKYLGFFSLVADQIATSFSDVHVLEEERKRTKALAEIDKAKTTFFSNISHEFRTPLTLLLAPLEDSLNDPHTNPENKVRLDVAHRNALRMQKLVNTLLEFSRIEAGRMEGRFSRVDIAALTEDLASTFRSAIERAGMHLHIHRGEISGDVYVDVDMWERIILNLVSNAFKYSRDGEIVVDIQQEGQLISVSVSDTGVGIPEDQLDKIFDRFYRVENSGGRSQEGTGIGLAMVKELVKLHHGTIRVESKPGEGSVFTIHMPVGKDHLMADRIELNNTSGPSLNHSTTFVGEALKWSHDEATQPEEPMETANGARKNKVLLADDNADMRAYVHRLLSDKFAVITAVDGEDAYEKILVHKPNLLLSDIMMPKLDGFGLLKRLRSHAELKNIPVIFLSARAGEEAKVEGLDAGADDYLIKPFSAKELLVRINNHIRVNQVRRETEQQFYQLFLQAPAIINVFKGPDFVYELFHPKNKEIFGDVDFTGMKLRDALPELEGQGIIEMLEDVYKNGKTICQNEQGVVFRDKQRYGESTDRYFNLINQPWYDLRGNIQGVLNFAIEVTDQVMARKKIEESEKKYRELTETLEVLVEKRTSELQRSNEDLQQFAHVASHDLKEPVRKFKTFVNRLQEEFSQSIPERGKNYLDKMQQASARMLSMIDGVLRYSSLNESEQTITRVDLNDIIASIETDLEVVIQQKNATITREHLPTVDGAPVLIYQLFYNLINNSLKFSREHPVITITSQELVVEGKDYAAIVVADNGIGFDQQYADRIFNAFTRLNSKDTFEGTGLGLALCKKIVERHRGTIAAQGGENQGATFTICLPRVHHEKRLPA
nr:ATP-binding protein [Chryseolinea lacunae]